MNLLLQLFFTFLQIGLCSIGGGYAIIPLIQEQVVEIHGWLSLKMFTDIITVSQMTPGPLAINTSTFTGLQIAGIPGAVVATFGCILCGVCISLSLYCFFQRHHTSVYVFEIFNGLKVASTGLILSAAFTILTLTLSKTGSETVTFASLDWCMLIMCLSSFFILRKWKINPILLMVIMGAIGIFF